MGIFSHSHKKAQAHAPIGDVQEYIIYGFSGFDQSKFQSDFYNAFGGHPTLQFSRPSAEVANKYAAGDGTDHLLRVSSPSSLPEAKVIQAVRGAANAQGGAMCPVR